MPGPSPGTPHPLHGTVDRGGGRAEAKGWEGWKAHSQASQARVLPPDSKRLLPCPRGTADPPYPGPPAAPPSPGCSLLPPAGRAANGSLDTQESSHDSGQWLELARQRLPPTGIPWVAPRSYSAPCHSPGMTLSDPITTPRLSTPAPQQSQTPIRNTPPDEYSP